MQTMPDRDQLSPAERHALDQLERIDTSRFNRLSQELHKESDRAALLMGAAWLDEGLLNLLRAHLLPSTTKEDQELFEGHGPLATFSARTKVSRRLGLISADFEQAINIIRRIRNKFAHSLETPNLSASPYREWINELPLVIESSTFWDLYQEKYHSKERGPHVTVRSVIALLSILLAGSIENVKRVVPQPLLGTNFSLTRKVKSISKVRSAPKVGSDRVEGSRAPTKRGER
jgi:hypothetical protein